MNNHNPVTTLQSQNAILFVLVLALIAQLPHAADVFRMIVHGSGVWATAHSYSFAIALELAVLLFVVQGRHIESYGFAAVSIAMNLSYYYLHDVHLFAWSALPALLVSVALPVAIARYSHAVAEVHPDVDHAQPQNAPESESAQVQTAVEDRDDQIVQDDEFMGLKERIAQLQSEGFDAKWIAVHECREIAGTQLASLLEVNASTISRWRKAAMQSKVSA